MSSAASSATGAASSTSPADGPALTRRRLLLGTAPVLALPLGQLTGCAEVHQAPDRGQPFADGSYFADGSGWVD